MCIYPDNWDLSELEKLSGIRGQGRPTYDQEDTNRFCGDVWLLEQVAEKIDLPAGSASRRPLHQES
jgi:hypothetical protein